MSEIPPVALDIEVVPQQDVRLGRNKVHDPRSRLFALATPVDRSGWHDKAIRIYDPVPNPNQAIGCCTYVAKCVQLNATGNRVKGRVLKMADAERGYSRATQIDPYPGVWPPQDTGSDGLATCKVAIEFGQAGEYRWLFGGADEVIATVMAGEPVSVGTWWYWDMFDRDDRGMVQVSGGRAGGHQYVIRGYDVDRDWALGRCWWGPTFKDFWIERGALDGLLADGGDAHVQRSVTS